MKYFTNCKSIEEAKRLFHKLAIKHHPDLGGDTVIMQEINSEFEKVFEKLKNIHESINNESQTYKTEQNSAEIPQEFMEIISKIIVMQDIEIELIGRWIWITGKSFPYKDTLKTLGFKWANQKKAWYWRKEEDAKRSSKTMSLDDIKNLYGSTKITNVKILQLA